MEDYVPPGLVYKFTPTARWQGTTNNDWLTNTNWEVDTIPSMSDHAEIPAGKSNYPLIDVAGTTCDNLIVESGAGVTVTSGGDLTVNGDLVNSGSVKVTSTSEASTGSLIVKGTSDATITFERYLSGDPSWHLISSPVSGQDLWSWATSAGNNIATNSSPSYYGITTYNEGIDNWNAYPTSDPSVSFEAGTGYSTLRQTNGTISFTGTIINSDVNNIPISYSGQGWNLLGNPYTSAIGATSEAASTDYLLSTTNVANLDPNYAGLYLWDPAAGSSGDYVIINNSGGVPNGTFTQKYIQAGQGFFVRSKTGGGTFNISRAMQTHQTSALFKSESVPWPTINLTAESRSDKSTTQISFNSNMTTGLDVTYDAGMFKNNPDFAFYSRLVDDNGVDFAIQCLPEDYNNLVIPLGLNTSVGTEITISAELFNLPADCEPYLEDRVTGKFIQLYNSGFYTFTTDDRYKGLGALFLHTSSNTVTQSKIEEINEPFKVISNLTDGFIRVVSSINKSALAKVYDITGRLVAVQEIHNGSNNLIYLSETPGVYIIHIKNERHAFSRKLFWK